MQEQNNSKDQSKKYKWIALAFEIVAVIRIAIEYYAEYKLHNPS